MTGTEITVLDHGYVRLVDSMGTDETIVEAARMSTGKGFTGWGTPDRPGDEKLLGFLWENQHTSPFEMCELHVEVQAPIMVFREWHRHRTQSYNEFSARYAQMPDLHYLPAPERIQRQSATNKQGSAEPVPADHAESIRRALEGQQSSVYDYYDVLVKDGVAKEVARLNTPVSRYSKMRAKTDLLNWLRFLGLRMAPNAQWEIRQYANAVAEIVKSIWPRSYALFEEHTLHGVRLSRSEVAALRAYCGHGRVTADKVPATLWKKLGVDNAAQV